MELRKQEGDAETVAHLQVAKSKARHVLSVQDSELNRKREEKTKLNRPQREDFRA